MVSLTDKMTRSLLRDVPHAALLVEGARIVYLNRAAARLLGGDSEADWIGASLDRSLRSGRVPPPDAPSPHPDTLFRADGTHLPVLIESFGLENGEQRLARIYLHTTTNEPRSHLSGKRGSSRTPASADAERSIIAALPDLVLLLNGAGAVVECNRSRPQAVPLKSPELIGRSLQDLLPPEIVSKLLPAVSAALRERATRTVEFSRTTGATSLFFETRLVPCGEDRLLAIFRDITRHRRTESDRLHEWKMEGIGRLAEGVASDLNDLLTAIIAHSEFARSEVPPDGVLSKHLDQIMLATDRATELTRRLLTFSVNHAGRILPVDLHELIEGLSDLFANLVGEKIHLRIVAGRGPCVVLADPHQQETLLTNLVLNARDAMPDGGRLTIATRPVRLRGTASGSGRARKDGDHAQVIVHDTGCGMTEEVRRRIFEPFFTTKKQGPGTGLGLSTCYGIVRQLDGQISALTRPGVGTTFVIHLPRHDRDCKSPGERQDWSSPKSSGTLLLVEDDTLVREVTTKALARMGYQVLNASHGVEGLEVARRHQGRIEALVTDIVMPHLGGRELATRLRVQLPHLKVLYISGYTHSALEARDLKKPGTAFLHKPFTPSELGCKLRKLLLSASDTV